SGQYRPKLAHWKRPMSALGQKQTCAVYSLMSALGQKRTSGREVRHATFDDVGLVSSHGAIQRTETGRRTQMAKLVDFWIFDWDKYSPDDLVQKCDSFQPGPASTPRGSREKQPCYHLRCSRSVASAAIRINPITPRVMAAQQSTNAIPRQCAASGTRPFTAFANDS